MENVLSFNVGLIIILICFVIVCGTSNLNEVFAVVIKRGIEGPIMKDLNLQVQQYATGLDFPSGMAFLEPDHVLAIEKNTGKVKEIKNGTVIGTILEVNVSNTGERGLLGIAISKQEGNDNGHRVSVFLYYTESEGFDGGKVLGNRLYRFELVNDKLINPKLLLDLPASPGLVHNGGKVLVDPDNNLFITIGDVGARRINGSTTT
jgi:aldose sugar dehydrogenase